MIRILGLLMALLGAPVLAAEQQHVTIQLAFQGDAADLTPEALGELQALAAKIPPGDSRVEIRAWGSAVGGGSGGASDMDARRLSLRRAMAARDALVKAGLALPRIVMRPLGRMAGGGANNQVEVWYRPGQQP